MDVDLHGPSIARMLGLQAQVCTCGGKDNILPLNLFSNLAVISIETLTGGQDAATIWRGPLKSSRTAGLPPPTVKI
jgi:Mrp family chromosome partitioning ATPase